jgi:hypothetical protein
MTIIEKEILAANADLSTNFIATRNIYNTEVSKMKAFRSMELLKPVKDVKRIEMLDKEIAERDGNYLKLLTLIRETVQYRDYLTGNYEAIIKPYNFVWHPIDALSFWKDTNINKGTNPFLSKVGSPFRVTTRNIFKNILPLPYDKRRLKGTGYLQSIRILDNSGYQSVGVNETYLNFNGVEIIVKEMLAGEAYTCFFVNANVSKIAPSDGIYIVSITGQNVEDLPIAYDENDPTDDGFDTGIKLNCIAIMDKDNFMYIFPAESFESNGKVLTKFYCWLPNTTYIF